MIRNGSRRPGGLCENALIEYGDAPNRHFPDRREIKTLIFCENVATHKVTGRSIKRSSYYCAGCTESRDRSSQIVERIDH